MCISVSGLNFKLKREQDTAVKSMLMNRDVLAVLPTGHGKSIVFQTYVMASEHRTTRLGPSIPPVLSQSPSLL